MDWIFIVGLVASAVVTVSYIPQVLHTIKLKHMKGISLLWLLLVVTGSALYFVYGLFLPSLPVAISSLAVAVMGAILVYHKLKYK